jgi:erythromycin esterase
VASLTIAAAVVVAAWSYLRSVTEVTPSPSGILESLAEAVTPLETDDPEAATSDLAPLVTVLRHRRVVALGEATHGTREFFRLKDRLFRCLVRDAGFTTFALEISPEAGVTANRFVRTGEGSARAALEGFEFWTWQTEELLALLEWMRAWNLAHPERAVTFVGINAVGHERDRRMAQNDGVMFVRRTTAARGL